MTTKSCRQLQTTWLKHVAMICLLGPVTCLMLFLHAPSDAEQFHCLVDFISHQKIAGDNILTCAEEPVPFTSNSAIKADIVGSYTSQSCPGSISNGSEQFKTLHVLLGSTIIYHKGQSQLPDTKLFAKSAGIFKTFWAGVKSHTKSELTVTGL